MASLRIPADLEKRLDNLAKITGRTKTFYITEALQCHIQNMEDRYLAFARLENTMPILSMPKIPKETGIINN